ncbi:uncharacterized protein LOC144037980 isoform X2 [Vanacampus margaritifer]
MRHISILLDGDTPTINKCTNSELFHCPFCKYKGAKYMVNNHIEGHSSVKHKVFTMIKCGLSCRTASHFHCCYCAATIINRLQLVRHLETHQEETHEAASIQRSVAPIQRSVAPAQQSVAPAQQSVAPAQQSVAPVQWSVAPAQQSVAPVQQSVAPAQQSVAPAQQSVAPAQQSVAPVQRSVAPAQQSVAPVQQSVAPAQQSVAPAQQFVALAQHSVAPAKQSVAPAQRSGSVAPVQQSVAPAQQFVAPVQQSVAPTKQSVAPAQWSGCVAPVQQSVAPAQQSVTPAQLSVAPSKQSVALAQQSVAPAQRSGSVAPVQQSVAPVQQTVAPAQQFVAPVQQSMAPVQRCVAPAQGSVAPAQQFVAPAQQSVAPAQQSVAPAQCPSAPTQHPLTPSHHPEAPMKHPLAPAQPPDAPMQHPEPPEPIQAPTECSEAPNASSEQKKFMCPHCEVILYKKNFKTHCRRKHGHLFETVSKDKFLACQCVDATRGVFAVEKSFSGPATPIHVVKNVGGATRKIMCEVDQCRLNADFCLSSGMLPFECHHIQSLSYCPRGDGQTVTLPGEALEIMVANKWLGAKCKASLLAWQQNAEAEGAALSVHLTVGGTPSRFHISVYEKKRTRYSRLGRVIASYDAEKNIWLCPCCKTRQSCIHKAVAKWHLFVTKRELFSKALHLPEIAAVQNVYGYPPDDTRIARMLEYLLVNKKLPADLPHALMEQSRDGRTLGSFPKRLVPRETECVDCEHTLCEQVVTSEGKILTSTGVVEGITTYRKSCPNCGMVYRYQEWDEGVHNFDDHIILSLHFCVMVRNALQTHTTISQVIEIIETTENVSFPNKERVLQAYLHFEALTDHQYTYSCASCGHSPAVVVMDFHKKALCTMPVSDVPSPPDNYDGHVDVNHFWNAVTTEIISRGFIPCGCAVITCPCGVVYSVKFNLPAETPRDFADLLLSWKHFPNVSVCDDAEGLALHADRRQPGIFNPFQGRLLDSTPENVKMASRGQVRVNVPWLRFPKLPADVDGHPVTGSSQHFALHAFRQGRSKDQGEVLRKMELVPELAGVIPSRYAERLFSGTRTNNYFLDPTTPSAHIFLQRNIIHHYNMARNPKNPNPYSVSVAPDVAMQCDITEMELNGQ